MGISKESSSKGVDIDKLTQLVRLADVLVIGPIMIYYGAKEEDPLLTIIGIGTILFNGHNLVNKKI